MAARESSALEKALKLLDKGNSISASADKAGIARSTLTRALRRRNIAPRSHPSGESHWNYRGGKATP